MALNFMVTADQSVQDNKWWKDIFRIYAKPGEYFEIHCWQDEKEAFRIAEKYGETACYTMPDLKIIHGTVTEHLISYILSERKPSDNSCYNKMLPFYTFRIGSNFSSEKYGTEIILKCRSSYESELLERKRLGDVTGLTMYRNK